MSEPPPWTVERIGSAIHIHISGPMTGEWEPLMDEIHAQIEQRRPLAIHLPSRIDGASTTDADMLKMLWDALTSIDIPLLPPA